MAVPMPAAPRLKAKYREEVRPKLRDELGYGNIMEVPTLEKIVVNMGVGDSLKDGRFLDAGVADLVIITGQQPQVRRARKSVAGFKLREGQARGNYTLGVTEQLIFPEIEYDKVVAVRGMDITIVTTADTDEEGEALLRALGVPLQARAAEASAQAS